MAPSPREDNRPTLYWARMGEGLHFDDAHAINPGDPGYDDAYAMHLKSLQRHQQQEAPPDGT